MFVEQLLKLKYRGTLSAKSVCILAYLAAGAGAVGPAKDVGCRPAAGHFQRRIDDSTLFKVEPERTYDVRVPRHDRLENDRVVTEIPFVPPHESIEEELAASVAAADTLATMCREQELHPNMFPASSGTLECTWHGVAAGHLRGLDSVLNAGILRIFVVNIVTSSRHLVGTMRKTGICKCGCRGRCSIFCVAEFVKWTCSAMTSGVGPTARHDGKPWRGDAHAARFQLAGTPLGFIPAPRAFTRASLATVNTRTCIRQVASDLAIYRGVSRTMTDSLSSLRTEHANVVAHLAWRKQNSGPRRRALDADIPA